jgi:hypothetical protein
MCAIIAKRKKTGQKSDKTANGGKGIEGLQIPIRKTAGLQIRPNKRNVSGAGGD